MEDLERTIAPVTSPDTEPVHAPARPSFVRAWCYLVRLCVERQARMQQMTWIALGLLLLTTMIVGLITGTGGWTKRKEYAQALVQASAAQPWATPAAAARDGVFRSVLARLDRHDLFVFSTWIVFSVYLSFLLPIWSLSFATEALGGDRETGSLVWLLTRPLPRSSIYLAKFLALLPWILGLNLGGFAVLCLAGGRPGALALRLYWPAVLWGSLAFCALFHLLGACFRRSTVLAIVYSFFLETILGNMPGYMKRASISFYTRCMMFEKAQEFGIHPQKPSVYLPVDGTTAWFVLMSVTVVLLLIGTIIFARTEYQDLT